MDLFDLPFIVGAAFSGGLLLLAFADYSRKPRFRIRSARRATTPAAAPAPVRAADWTYTPFAA
jgi:hypothetical protein